MSLSIPDESMFKPNPIQKYTQPILQDNINVPQVARDCLKAILKDYFLSIVSKSPTDIGKTKLFEINISTKGPHIACRPYPILLKYQ